MSYDLADDSIWSLNIGCSGAVDIRIERIDDDPVTRAWLGVLERGEPAVLVTRLSGTTGRRLVFPSGASIGSLGSSGLDASADARARAQLATPHPLSEAIGLDGADHGESPAGSAAALVPVWKAADFAASCRKFEWKQLGGGFRLLLNADRAFKTSTPNPEGYFDIMLWKMLNG